MDRSTRTIFTAKTPEGGAVSSSFSGDRAGTARRKVLYSTEASIPSHTGSRKKHEAERSVLSPATLPNGEWRGFGGKAPECLSKKSYLAGKCGNTHYESCNSYHKTKYKEVFRQLSLLLAKPTFWINDKDQVVQKGFFDWKKQDNCDSSHRCKIEKQLVNELETIGFPWNDHVDQNVENRNNYHKKQPLFYSLVVSENFFHVKEFFSDYSHQPIHAFILGDAI